MPRRIPDYSTQFADWNKVSSIGGFCFGLAQLLFPYIIIKCIRGGAKAPARVWALKLIRLNVPPEKTMVSPGDGLPLVLLVTVPVT